MFMFRAFGQYLYVVCIFLTPEVIAHAPVSWRGHTYEDSMDRNAHL